MFNNQENQYTNITTNTATQVATGKGRLHLVVVNTAAAGTVIIADGTAASSTVIGTLKASVAEGTYVYDVYFAKGLRITTAASTDITVSWSQS